MWNDTDLPLGYLITFRCYGTWLHGNERGSIDRFHNRFKTPCLPRSGRRRELNTGKLKSDPDTLNAEQRQSVDSAIREGCAHRNWFLPALNVRTNHVHIVVSIGADKPERALNALKARDSPNAIGWKLARVTQPLRRRRQPAPSMERA